jgi:hypothetical protein
MYTMYTLYMSYLHYPSVTAARENIKLILDAAERGQVVSVERNAHRSAVVDAERLRAFFLATVPSNAQIVHEEGAWVITMPGRPIAAESTSYEGALNEIVDALREYAADWNERLFAAPNHEKNWGLVQLVSYSTDDQLRDWLTRAPGE